MCEKFNFEIHCVNFDFWTVKKELMKYIKKFQNSNLASKRVLHIFELIADQKSVYKARQFKYLIYPTRSIFFQ